MKFEEAIEKLGLEARQKIKNSNSLEDMLDIFSKNGLQVTKEDILNSIKNKSNELSDDELATVTGGIDVTSMLQDLLKLFAKKMGENND